MHSTMRFFGIVAGLGFVSATTVFGQEREQVVVLSAAGGISNGSYQGGVDWTISEFLRRQQSDALRTKIFGRDVNRRFVLRSATGASAGNIDALFAAIGWCTHSTGASPPPSPQAAPTKQSVAPIKAEDSLFWQAWIPTGTAQLLPSQNDRETLGATKTRDISAFDRAFFRKAHLDSLRTFLATATAIPDCKVPLGLTLTKLTPVQVELLDPAKTTERLQGQDAGAADRAHGPEGDVEVQRFASVLEVKANGSNVDFGRLSTKHEQDRSLGALALLPALKSAAESGRGQRLEAVFNVVLASSAFPMAFAPVELCYEPGGMRPAGGTSDPCPSFTDGGVFDNNPVGLGHRLAELGGEFPRGLDVTIAYSSPGNLRGPLKEARQATGATKDRAGVSAVFQLLAGAYASARDYELQAFARLVSRDNAKPASRQPIALALSSRSTPIFGETVRSFGAFLGRPLREYDFYVGIYDGLEFVARQFICGDEIEAGSRETCTSDAHARLLAEDSFTLSVHARQVACWQFVAEYPAVTQDLVSRICDAKVENGIKDESRFKILKALHEALSARRSVRPDVDAARCAKKSGPVEALVCPGGLDQVLDGLGSQAEWVRKDWENKATRTVNCSPLTIPGEPDGQTATFDRIYGRCLFDEHFVELLEHPRHQVYSVMKKAIESIELGEDELESRGLPDHAALVEWAFSLQRSSTYKYRGPVDAVMSSARQNDYSSPRASVATLVGYLAPGYIQWTYSGQAPDDASLGWRPLTWNLGKDIFLGSTLDLSLRWLSSSSKFTNSQFGYGASIGSYSLPLPLIGAKHVDVGPYWMSRPQAAALAGVDFTQADRSPRLVVRASARVFADKLQVTALWRPRHFTMSVGLSDVNGLLFWWIR
jgi:Patatin-like phospholipase